MEYVKGQVNSQVTTDNNRPQEATHEKVRKQRYEEETTKQKSKQKRLVRIRIIPIWLRLFIIAALIAISAIAGVVIGYGVIGSGEPEDALKKSTWQHIIDLVEKQK
ncbi:DNA-directed RNA polymerase subunit beta [Litchfieldia alkalitelluris]|uniref:DNA-directed RNA polymerase subunit beta n=1 Tax=Litchfieldia alkalitelluris TaxID=304268 RepID=UPI0009961EC6|nr:DNA-directed RNA polymerase subunit beta [Litchfieldia alkalitelluris]